MVGRFTGGQVLPGWDGVGRFKLGLQPHAVGDLAGLGIADPIGPGRAAEIFADMQAADLPAVVLLYKVGFVLNVCFFLYLERKIKKEPTL